MVLSAETETKSEYSVAEQEKGRQSKPASDDSVNADINRNRFYFWSQTFKIINHIIRTATIVAIAYFALLAVEALAGKETSILTSFLFVKSNHGLPWALVVALLIWAVSERKLRQRKTKSMETHIKNLETTLDPARTSSGLLATGQTNPKDQ